LSTETEIKVKIDDPESFCRQLNAFSPRVVSVRHFEDNQLLDFADGRLRADRCLIRIRYAKGAAILTYKGPPKAEGIFKTREELETQLKDGMIAQHILEKLGMGVYFRYQKYRREYAVGAIQVAVDETPVGNYCEFEGSEDGIRELTRKMGIAESQFMRLSYYSLYVDDCRQRGMNPGSMVF